MKNIVVKLAMICLFSGCYAVFVAWKMADSASSMISKQ